MKCKLVEGGCPYLASVPQLPAALEGTLCQRMPLLACQGFGVHGIVQEMHAQQVPALLCAIGGRQRGS